MSSMAESPRILKLYGEPAIDPVTLTGEWRGLRFRLVVYTLEEWGRIPPGQRPRACLDRTGRAWVSFTDD